MRTIGIFSVGRLYETDVAHFCSAELNIAFHTPSPSYPAFLHHTPHWGYYRTNLPSSFILFAEVTIGQSVHPLLLPLIQLVWTRITRTMRAYILPQLGRLSGSTHFMSSTNHTTREKSEICRSFVLFVHSSFCAPVYLGLMPVKVEIRKLVQFSLCDGVRTWNEAKVEYFPTKFGTQISKNWKWRSIVWWMKNMPLTWTKIFKNPKCCTYAKSNQNTWKSFFFIKKKKRLQMFHIILSAQTHNHGSYSAPLYSIPLMVGKSIEESLHSPGFPSGSSSSFSEMRTSLLSPLVNPVVISML